MMNTAPGAEKHAISRFPVNVHDQLFRWCHSFEKLL